MIHEYELSNNNNFWGNVLCNKKIIVTGLLERKNECYIFAVKIHFVTHTCFPFGSRCGTEGVRVDCTATNNTVCNERSEGML